MEEPIEIAQEYRSFDYSAHEKFCRKVPVLRTLCTWIRPPPTMKMRSDRTIVFVTVKASNTSGCLASSIDPPYVVSVFFGNFVNFRFTFSNYEIQPLQHALCIYIIILPVLL